MSVDERLREIEELSTGLEQLRQWYEIGKQTGEWGDLDELDVILKEQVLPFVETLPALIEMVRVRQEALKRIVNPIAHLQEEADKNGWVLNGKAAIECASDSGYLRGIAEKALAHGAEEAHNDH